MEYYDIFGRNNFYLEMQDHGFPEQRTVNRELLRLSKDLSLPLVATTTFIILSGSMQIFRMYYCAFKLVRALTPLAG
ncbi:hypothetical protein N752_27515 [Desulforamulus aquiferis]|nr:hypothetical protein [Desulforamulus aquiferis]RYD01876.1 hypothetical protein N752_27515 [Desulforamulus aquiferis]